MKTKLKYLCVCRRGNVRSVGLAYQLKELYGCPAVAIGFETCGPEAMTLLCAWADVVLVVKPAFLEQVPPEFAAKTRAVAIGPDVWHNPFHPELQDRIGRLLVTEMIG